MILIDYSQIAISNIAIQLSMSKDKNVLSVPMVRHMILNSIRGFVHRFRNDYPGEIILCIDGPSPWRREIFEHYKAPRKVQREKSDFDWSHLYTLLNNIRDLTKTINNLNDTIRELSRNLDSEIRISEAKKE